MTFSDPDSARNLELDALGPISLLASWEPPAVVTEFNFIRLTLSADEWHDLILNVSASNTSYTFNCLQPDTTYTLSISSVLVGDGIFEEQVAAMDDIAMNTTCNSLF